jgi:diguanylate cyclase (GGDEF)-like protein
MAHLSIRIRLILAFGLLLTLLLPVSVVALVRFDTLELRINQFVDHHARIAFLAQRANQHAQHATLNLLRLLQTPDREQRVPLYLTMDQALADSDAAVRALERDASMNVGSAEIVNLVKARTAYEASFQQTVELIELEGLAAARRHFETETDASLTRLLGATLAIARQQQESLHAEVARLESDAAQARWLVIGLALGALLLGGTLAVLIARSIARRVSLAAEVARTIAKGNYAIPVPPGKGPEIGVLMSALDTMRGSIAYREKRILELAYTDTLTGLPNRTRFLEVFAETIGAGGGALMVMDVDRFAAINNALGPGIGDRMLREIGQRLRMVIPDGSFVARLGGDVFAVLAQGIDRPAACELVGKTLARMREPMHIDGQRLDVETSFAIVLFPDDGASVTALLRRADLAMTLAKRRHDGHAFGADVSDEPAHEQLALIGEMREALAREEFVAFLQPKVDLASGRIKGVEALLRWRHPTRGLVPPGRFIPFAEQTGFIREITPWLLRHVVHKAAEWHRAGLDIVASVNLSTLDLSGPTLVSYVGRLLEERGLPAHLLCLEITESALMDDPEAALRHLGELAALGVRLSIDDYGSGQASLAYVQQLPVHELKIDRVFVDKVDQRPKNAAIVRSTILLCRELGLSVVAEGAETQEEVAWLARNACDIVQGYGIARPMPAEDFIDWAAKWDAALPGARAMPVLDPAGFQLTQAA